MIQAIVLAIVILALVFLGYNLDHSLKRLGIRLGFKFLNSQAGFSVAESVIPYDPSQPYSRVLLVGLLNSLKVILSAMVLSTAIGLVALRDYQTTGWSGKSPRSMSKPYEIYRC
jgi:general L-amino acid transport system permease protein